MDVILLVVAGLLLIIDVFNLVLMNVMVRRSRYSVPEDAPLYLYVSVLLLAHVVFLALLATTLQGRLW